MHCGKGACVVRGCVRGRGPCVVGACMVGGVHGRGHAWQWGHACQRGA